MNKYLKEKGPKVVVIGGGTGTSVILRGLKKYTSNITAIITVTDDGGNSGALREDLGMLPPGDIRSCILALADTEPIMEKLIQYRFEEGTLKGQNMGNLLLAAMNAITGSFEEAIRKTSDVLKVKGTVLPVTLDDITLVAELENGEKVMGESQIPKVALEKKLRIKKISLNPPKATPLKFALKALEEADAIILGPGSLYTSIIPNLLVEGLVEGIAQAEALKIYIANIMTQPGETDHYNVMDHVQAILDHSNKPIIDWIISNSGMLPEYLEEKYKIDGSSIVLMEEEIKQYPYNFMIEDFIEIKKHYVRHDADKLAYLIYRLIAEEKLAKDDKRKSDYNYLKHLLNQNAQTKE